MFTVSDRWRRAVTYGGSVRSYVDIVDSNNEYVITNLDVTAGSCTIDRTRDTRRECSLTIQDPKGLMVPEEYDDLLQPYAGFYFRLWKGFVYRDGTEEVVPLGTFAPWNPKVSETPNSVQIQVQGFDRSKIIAKTRWTEGYVIPEGTNTAVAVRDMLQSRMSGLTMALRPTKSTVPLTALGTDTNNDPWKDAVKIANADGMELYFDANDVVRLEPSADDPDTANPTMIYEDGPTCTVTKFDRETDAESQYTGVIVRSEGSGLIAPIRVEVWRQDTTLRIPYFMTTSYITTYAQALAAGIAQLRKIQRAEIAVSLGIVPDVSQEVDDVIHVRSTRSRIDDQFLISSMSIPLDESNEMSLQTAQRRLA